MFFYRFFLVSLFLFPGGLISVYGSGMAIDSVSSKTSKIDSIQAKPAVKHKIIPRVATIRSMIFPGLGQVYNRQYWKLPLVAGAFVSLGLIAKYNIERYQKYRDYYWIVSPHPDEPGYVPPKTVPVTYEDGISRDLDANQLKRIVDGFRRNRDFTYVGMFIAWAFNVVDANVSAHLRTFDVTDDISLKVKPNFDFNPYQNNIVTGLSFNFQFK